MLYVHKTDSRFNQQKSFELDCSIDKMKKQLLHLPLITEGIKDLMGFDYGYKLSKENKSPSIFTFESTNNKATISVSLTSRGTSKCFVEIELIEFEPWQTIGLSEKKEDYSDSLNEMNENVSRMHIDNMLALITRVKDLSKNDIRSLQNRQKEIEVKKEKQRQKNKVIKMVLIAIIILFALIYFTQ